MQQKFEKWVESFHEAEVQQEKLRAQQRQPEDAD